MRNEIRLTVLAVIFLMIEAVYFSVAGRLVNIFSPQIFLLGSALIGILLGPVVGVLWAAAAGLMEELCFISPSSALGLTPLAYCWTAYVCARLFHGRVDVNNPAIGLVASAISLVFGWIAGYALAAAFSVSADLLTGPLTWGRAVSFIVQVCFLGPILIRILSRVLLPRRETFWAGAKEGW